MLSCVLTDGCVWAELRVEEHRCTGEHYLFSSLQNTITRFHYHHQSCLFSTSFWSHVWGHIQASQNRSTFVFIADLRSVTRPIHNINENGRKHKHGFLSHVVLSLCCVFKI